MAPGAAAAPVAPSGLLCARQPSGRKQKQKARVLAHALADAKAEVLRRAAAAAAMAVDGGSK